MKIPAVAIAVFAALAAAADIVAESADNLVFRQPDGETVTLPKHPSRVVIGYISLARPWELSGGKAVGVMAGKDAEALPESMRGLPKIGIGMTPEAEAVMALNPDLVLLSARIERHRDAAVRLRKAGIPAVCMPYENYADYMAMLEVFCKLNGTAPSDIPRIAEARAKVELICEKAAKIPEKPRIAIIFATASGFSLESERTNAGSIAKMLGAVNINGDAETPRTPFSYEHFLLADPDAVFVVTMGDAKALEEKFRSEFMDSPTWRELRAAKAGRVNFLEPGLFLYMPGMEYPQAFRRMAELLYPGKEFK